MNRLSWCLLLSLLAIVPLAAQPIGPPGVTIIRTEANCAVAACAVAGELCVTGTTVYVCNTATGLFEASGGDVIGPASSTDNAIVRFNGTGGKTIQNYTSGAPTITDTGNLEMVNFARWTLAAGASALRRIASGAGASPYDIWETSTGVGTAVWVDGNGDFEIWSDDTPTDFGLRINTQTGDESTNTVDVHAVDGDFVLDSAGTFFRDGAGGFAGINAQIVHICPAGCEYANLNTACTSETSSAVTPITFRVHAGVYTTRVTACSSQVNASIVGDGPYATHISVTGLATNEGAIELGAAQNVSIANMAITGNIAIHGSGTIGDIYLDNLRLESPSAAGVVGHCTRFAAAASATRIFYSDVHCMTGEEGFSIGETGASYKVYERGSVITNTSDGNVSQGSYCWNFGSNPEFFYSKGAICDRIHNGSENEDFGCINQKQNQAGGFDGALSVWDDLTCRLRSTAAVADNVDIKAIDVSDVTTTLDSTLRFSNLNIHCVLDNGAAGGGNDNDCYGIFLEDVGALNPAIEVYGGSITGDAGISGRKLTDQKTGDNERIKVSNLNMDDSADTNKIDAQDYGLLGHGAIETAHGIVVDAETVASFNQPWITVTATTSSRDGIKLLHGTTTDTISPKLEFCNDTNEDECMYLSVDTNGNLEFRDDAGALMLELEADGDLRVVDDMHVDKTGGSVFICNGAASDACRLYFNAATTDYSRTWNDTANRVEDAGADVYRRGAPLATAPATCVIGDEYNDSSGGKCYCSATNTWEQLNAVGDCT